MMSRCIAREIVENHVVFMNRGYSLITTERIITTAESMSNNLMDGCALLGNAGDVSLCSCNM